MKLANAVTLVTGANRGLGRSLVNALIDAGAPKIYLSARDLSNLPEYSPTASVVQLELDITDASQVSRAASLAPDVTLLINNAGYLPRGNAMSMSEEGLRGAIVNVLSLLSLFNEPLFAAYCAAKHASWAMTQSLREDLAATRVRVLSCFAGGIDPVCFDRIPYIVHLILHWRDPRSEWLRQRNRHGICTLLCH